MPVRSNAASCAQERLSFSILAAWRLCWALLSGLPAFLDLVDRRGQLAILGVDLEFLVSRSLKDTHIGRAAFEGNENGFVRGDCLDMSLIYFDFASEVGSNLYFSACDPLDLPIDGRSAFGEDDVGE